MEIRRKDWVHQPITLIGHPFANVGMAEGLRSHVSSLRAVGLRPKVLDIYRYTMPADPHHARLLGNDEVQSLPAGIRVFHINGDEVAPTLDVLAGRGDDFAAGINVIAPAWELPRYPDAWVAELQRFDEVWSFSTFLQESLAAAGVKSEYISQSGEVGVEPFLSRKEQGIREDAFVLLSFLDLSSYATRKNPDAALRLMNMIAEDADIRAGYRPIQCVLKVKDAHAQASDWAREFSLKNPNVRFITHPLTTFETRSLINACDCLVSLHRSEGFGRGPAEAMALGRLVLATNWSGNTDFMRPDNSLPVDYTLAPVAPNAYPHCEGQSWATPDVEHASRLLKAAIFSPERSRALRSSAAATIRRDHSHRAVGVRCLARLLNLQQRYEDRIAVSSDDALA